MPLHWCHRFDHLDCGTLPNKTCQPGRKRDCSPSMLTSECITLSYLLQCFVKILQMNQDREIDKTRWKSALSSYDIKALRHWIRLYPAVIYRRSLRIWAVGIVVKLNFRKQKYFLGSTSRQYSSDSTIREFRNSASAYLMDSRSSRAVSGVYSDSLRWGLWYSGLSGCCSAMMTRQEEERRNYCTCWRHDNWIRADLERCGGVAYFYWSMTVEFNSKQITLTATSAILRRVNIHALIGVYDDYE